MTSETLFFFDGTKVGRILFISAGDQAIVQLPESRLFESGQEGSARIIPDRLIALLCGSECNIVIWEKRRF